MVVMFHQQPLLLQQLLLLLLQPGQRQGQPVALKGKVAVLSLTTASATTGTNVVPQVLVSVPVLVAVLLIQLAYMPFTNSTMRARVKTEGSAPMRRPCR
jgi:hypothetical protein